MIMLIDMVAPSDRNTSAKVAEKLSKYKDLEIEIARMWGMKTQIVPVVIGALGVIKNGIDEQICKIPGKINVTELQKIHPYPPKSFAYQIKVDYPLEP